VGGTWGPFNTGEKAPKQVRGGKKPEIGGDPHKSDKITERGARKYEARTSNPASDKRAEDAGSGLF